MWAWKVFDLQDSRANIWVSFPLCLPGDRREEILIRELRWFVRIMKVDKYKVDHLCKVGQHKNLLRKTLTLSVLVKQDKGRQKENGSYGHLVSFNIWVRLSVLQFRLREGNMMDPAWIRCTPSVQSGRAHYPAGPLGTARSRGRLILLEEEVDEDPMSVWNMKCSFVSSAVDIFISCKISAPKKATCESGSRVPGSTSSFVYSPGATAEFSFELYSWLRLITVGENKSKTAKRKSAWGQVRGKQVQASRPLSQLSPTDSM